MITLLLLISSADLSHSAWQVNTELLTFDVEDVKKDVESGNSAKKNKALWSAYEIAAEGHDLAYFKGMLARDRKSVV